MMFSEFHLWNASFKKSYFFSKTDLHFLKIPDKFGILQNRILNSTIDSFSALCTRMN